jgi:hypothetical protein
MHIASLVIEVNSVRYIRDLVRNLSRHSSIEWISVTVMLLARIQGISRFESRPGHWLSFLRFIMVFLIPSRYIPGQYID